MPSCLVIGAGMAGLTAARLLLGDGWRVVVLDKGRGVGGRLATRRIGEARFDHGAQFITVRDALFQQHVDRWLANGWIAPWFEDGGHIRYRSEGGMSQLAKHLAVGLDIRTGVKVESIGYSSGGWRASTDTGETFQADALVMTAPPEQALAMLAGCTGQLDPAVLEHLQAVEFDPCFALMVVAKGPGLVPAPGYFRPAAGPIEWLADNVRKGISGSGGSALTIHARGDYSRQRFEVAPEEVARELLEAARPWIGGTVDAWQLHRWKFAKPVSGPCLDSLYSEVPAPVAFAGDGLAGGRVEGAFLSGVAAAAKLSESPVAIGREPSTTVE